MSFTLFTSLEKPKSGKKSGDDLAPIPITAVNIPLTLQKDPLKNFLLYSETLLEDYIGLK